MASAVASGVVLAGHGWTREDRTWVFDFGRDTPGVKPSYISLPWRQTEVQVVETAWAQNGRALRIEPYGRTNRENAFFAAIFEPIPPSRDVEMLIRFRDVGEDTPLHWMTGVGARIRGVEGSETGLLTQSRAVETGLVVARVNQGEFREGFTHFQVDKDQHLRVRWVADMVWAKMWNGSMEKEPDEWDVMQHFLPDPTMESGRVGVTRFFSQHASEIDWVRVTVLDDRGPDGIRPHPADTNQDWRISISELTSYGAAWRAGTPWVETGSRVPIVSLTRAGYLWRGGGAYSSRRNDAGELEWTISGL